MKRVIEMTNYRYRNLRIFFVVFSIVFALGTFMNWVDSRIGISVAWFCLGLNYLFAYLSEKQENSILKLFKLDLKK